MKIVNKRDCLFACVIATLMALNLLLLTQVHHDRKAQVQMLEDAIDHRIAAREKAIAQKQVKLINAIRTAFNQPVVEMGDLNEMFSAFFSAYTPIYEPKN